MRNLQLSVMSCAFTPAKLCQLGGRSLRLPALIAGFLIACSVASPCLAVEPSIYLIEEDWDMVINEPDAQSHCPQVSFFMSPCELEHAYFQLQLNYAADVNFSGGGFHVAAVSDDVLGDEERSTTNQPLTTAHDHVRWTSVMALINDKFYFAVKNGQCQDWGAFGGPDYLVEMPATGHDLSNYHPQTSLDNVDIGFGGNRVASITLKSVTVHYTNGTKTKMVINRQP